MAISKQKVHFIGIGGIGASALARWFLAQNWAVSGSDLLASKITRELAQEGAKVKIGHKKANLPFKTKLVVYSQAVSSGNPEIKKAKKEGIPLLSYPEAVGGLTGKYKTISIVGAHGKSTVTAFVSLALIKGGFDPTVIIGTRLKQFGPPEGKNFREGGGEYLVLEACEWKNAFLNYSPAAAIITNIDREHLDFFKNILNIKKSFLKFISNVKNGGLLVLNKDDKNLKSLAGQIKKIAAKNKIRVFWYGLNPLSPAAAKIKNVLKVPGAHNLSNALAAYTLARQMGISEKIILKALGGYRGIWRRLELRGTLRKSIANNIREYSRINSGKIRDLKIPVYDDYAHHPTEIKASLQALREKYPKSKIICVFQPHQAERLKALFKDFVSAFDGADKLILLPVYEVAGRDRKNKKFTSQKLAEAITRRITQNSRGTARKNLREIIYFPHPENISSALKKILRDSAFGPRLSALVVMMGAGDIVKYTPLLLK